MRVPTLQAVEIRKNKILHQHTATKKQEVNSTNIQPKITDRENI